MKNTLSVTVEKCALSIGNLPVGHQYIVLAVYGGLTHSVAGQFKTEIENKSTKLYSTFLELWLNLKLVD